MPRLRLPKERTVLAMASPFKRLFAFIIDFIIVDFIIFSAFEPLISSMVPSGGVAELIAFFSQDSAALKNLAILSSIMGVLGLAYFAVLEATLGQSIGKMIMGISVISEGKKLSWWQAIVRSLFMIPLFPFAILWIVDPVFLIFSGRRFLEILSRTRTVELVRVG